jgi:outer membrane protein
MIKKHLILTFALATAAGGAHATIPHADPPVTYADAVRMALSKRAEPLIEKLNIDKQAAGIDEAKAASLPSLDFSTTVQHVKSYQDFSGIEVNAVVDNTTIPVSVKAVTPGYLVQTGLSLTYNVYSGGLNQARVNEKLAAKQGALARLDAVRKTLVLEITSAYWELRKEQVLYRTALHSLAYAKESLSVARSRFEEGQIARIELEAIVLAAETREIELHDRLRHHRDRLRRYYHALGLDQVAAPMDDALLKQLSSQALEVDVDLLLSELGLARAPEGAIARANVAVAAARAEQAKSEYLPNVDLVASYGGIGRNNSFSGMTSDYGRDAYRVGVRLKWNLFSGFGSNARASQASLERQLMQLKADQVQQDLEQSWQEKRSREEELKSQLTLAVKQSELAQAELQIAQHRSATQQASLLHLRAARLKAEEAANKATILQIDLLVASVSARLLASD